MCTSIAAGKSATSDGVTLIARNEDFGQNNWNKYLKVRKAPQYAGKEKWILGNGLVVDVPSKSYRYCAIPDAAGSKEAASGIDDCFYFEERGINERNVSMSATNSMDMNEAAIKADPPVKVGIEESILLTLILPQADSARDAVILLGYYVEEYGACEANGILFGDAEEVWYFEIGSCHNWIAVRIPDDSYLVVANCMRVHDVDLSAENNQNVLYSKGLYEFVIDNNLLEEPKFNQFNFAKAFGQPESIVEKEKQPNYNIDRIWLAQHILSPSQNQATRQKEYPLFLKPDKSIHIQDVMKVLRADYKDTELENEATRPIGVVRTAESHIMVIDPKMPKSLKGVIWQTIGTPLGTPYMPMFAVMDEIPDSYMTGESIYNSNSAYWSFRSLFSLSAANHRSILCELWEEYEKQLMREHVKMKEMLIPMYQENEMQAVDFAKHYSEGVLCRTAETAKRELDQLLTDIAVEQKDQ